MLALLFHFFRLAGTKLHASLRLICLPTWQGRPFSARSSARANLDLSPDSITIITTPTHRDIDIGPFDDLIMMPILCSLSAFDSPVLTIFRHLRNKDVSTRYFERACLRPCPPVIVPVPFFCIVESLLGHWCMRPGPCFMPSLPAFPWEGLGFRLGMTAHPCNDTQKNQQS